MISPKSIEQEVSSALLPPIPTPHWGAQSGCSFTIRATTTIHAPPRQILDTLLDTTTWPAWNNFVPNADLDPPTQDGKLHPGIAFTEHVDMSGRGKSSRDMQLQMTTLDPLPANGEADKGKSGFRVVWLGKGYPDWALRSERVHEIYCVRGGQEGGEDGEATVYDVFETFSGPLAAAVRLFVGKKLVERFGQWNGELKGYVEGRDSAGG